MKFIALKFPIISGCQNIKFNKCSHRQDFWFIKYMGSVIHLSAVVMKELKNCSDSENVTGGLVPVPVCDCLRNRSLSLWNKRQENLVEMLISHPLHQFVRIEILQWTFHKSVHASR